MRVHVAFEAEATAAISPGELRVKPPWAVSAHRISVPTCYCTEIKPETETTPEEDELCDKLRLDCAYQTGRKQGFSEAIGEAMAAAGEAKDECFLATKECFGPAIDIHLNRMDGISRCVVKLRVLFEEGVGEEP